MPEMLGTVYVDFDGTIAPADPTDALFDRFCDPSWREIEEDWQQGRCTAQACMAKQVDLLRATPRSIDAAARHRGDRPAVPRVRRSLPALGYAGCRVVRWPGPRRRQRVARRRHGPAVLRQSPGVARGRSLEAQISIRAHRLHGVAGKLQMQSSRQAAGSAGWTSWSVTAAPISASPRARIWCSPRGDSPATASPTGFRIGR